jgi:hypothetical protein
MIGVCPANAKNQPVCAVDFPISKTADANSAAFYCYAVEVVMLTVDTGCVYTQAHGCRFCLHVGTLAFYFGRRLDGRGPRLELLTPKRWFRWSPGYVQGRVPGDHLVQISETDLRELNRKVWLSNWLIEMRCHVIEDSAIRKDSWVCVDVDGDVVGRGRNYYDAIQNAMNSVSKPRFTPG